jgi:phosphate transport system permease protein
VVVGSPHYAVLFFLGAALFFVTFVINAVAAVLVARLRRTLRGA